MEHVNIANTGLVASRIGLGTWAIGGLEWGGADDQASITTIHRALALGVTLIDTAPIYGHGHAEAVVGEALKGRRDHVLITTKVGLEWDAQGNVQRNGSRARIEQELDASLRRLQTDRIDVYQLHWPDPQRIEETAETLLRFFHAGKVRAIGVSNFSVDQMNRFRTVAPLHTLQPPYNLFEQAAGNEILPYAAANSITSLTYGALCRGLLSGRMSETTVFSGDDLRRREDVKFQLPRFQQYVRAVRRLDDLARERFGKRVIHLALRWVLDQPGVGVALWGARRASQLDPLPQMFDFHVDKQTDAAIASILAEEIKDPVGPEFMTPP